MKRFLQFMAYLLAIHVTALLMQAAYRLLFLMAVRDQLPAEVRTDWGLQLTAFVRGLWFDNVIACYVLLLPLVIAGGAVALGFGGRRTARAAGIWCATLHALTFMASAANIPYFCYFTKVINSSIWNWAEYGTTTAAMVLGEASYYFYIASWFVFVIALALLVRYYYRLLRPRLKTKAGGAGCRAASLATVLLASGLCLFGIRGRMGYNPIKVSAAYFCNNTVLNQMGISPTFNLLTSTLDDQRRENRTLRLMDGEKAVAEARLMLDRPGIEGISPLARRVSPKGEARKHNVVLVMMESMSARLMQRFGNDQGLTPCLDSLWHRSLTFSNFYSAGTHTNHGLYATLYSFPSIMKRNAMKGSAIPVYSGLPTVLRENGYSTLFFMTHESQYDNMNAFFRTNGYEEIYSQENYPREKVANHFGVQDDYLFEYALPVLRRHAATGRPFFATLLTISNHPPYVIPGHFKPRSQRPEEQVVEFADWSVGRFMEAAAREPWYKNTVFVFLGDHGKMLGEADCELPESYNHIPLIILGPDIPAGERSDFAGQVDVGPTLLGLLNLPYVQNNFGIDLLRERRPAMFYTADNTVAARDSAHLYIYNPDAGMEYCYHTGSGRPVPAEMTEETRRLKTYCFTMLQATESLVQRRLTLDHPEQKNGTVTPSPKN